MGKYSLILLSTLGLLVLEGHSQSILDEFPNCAATCVSAVLPESCIEASCICDSPSSISSISCCLSTSCDTADQEKSISLAKQLCGSNAGIPNSAGCSTSTSTTSSTSSTPSTSSISSATSSCTTCTGNTASTGTGSSVHSDSSTTFPMPTGVKVGIGVGVAVGVILLVLIAVLIYRLRRRRKASGYTEKPHQGPGLAVQYLHVQNQSPTISTITPEVDGASSQIGELQATKTAQVSSMVPKLAGNMFCGKCGAKIETPFCTLCGGKAVFKVNTATRYEMDTNAARVEADGTSRNIQVSGQILPTTSHAFKSLVERSIVAWESLTYFEDADVKEAAPKLAALLRSFESIDAFFSSPRLFWFFQHRESFQKQTRFLKFDLRHLDNYIILPMDDGFVNKKDCFYVSHFWRSKEVPDPLGEDFRLVQKDLSSQAWKYVWVDWTCLPQDPVNAAEKRYFNKMLERTPTLMRECGFTWRYPAFEPRLWILVEVAEYMMNTYSYVKTPDMKPFVDDVLAMKSEGVHQVITRRGYKCSVPRDHRLLVHWLELLFIMVDICPEVPLTKLLLDSVEPSNVAELEHMDTGIKVDKNAGTVSTKDGAIYRFTPLAPWPLAELGEL